MMNEETLIIIDHMELTHLCERPKSQRLGLWELLQGRCSVREMGSEQPQILGISSTHIPHSPVGIYGI